MYEMKEEYKTGIESIDICYERLFKIIDKAYEILDGTSVEKHDKLIKEIEKFKREIKKYFKEQEEYLIDISYNDLELQKQENEEFTKKLEQIDIENRLKKGNEYVINILQYFSDWLVEHILNIEKKVAI